MEAETQEKVNYTRRNVLLGAAALVTLCVSSGIYLASQRPRKNTKQEVIIANDTSGPGFIEYATSPRSIGAPSAPVEVIEFFSMTCSHCALFHNNTFPKVKEQLIDRGLVRYEMRAFPLDGLALRAHAMARSLPIEKYYPMIDMLMKKQSSWTNAEDPLEALRKLGLIAGMSRAEFDATIRNRALLESIVAMRQAALKKWEVQATPSFVINNKTIISGNLSYDEFAEKINTTST